jgi:NADH-quinone oxidoreductase subunit J
MDVQSLFATVIAALTLASALMVVLSRNAIYAAFFLLVTLFGVAIEYALLSAHFLAVIQILVYAGAVVVLIVFVLMMMGFGRGGFQGFFPVGPQIALSVGFLALLLGAGGLGGLVGESLRPAPLAAPAPVSGQQPTRAMLRPALQGTSKAPIHPPFLASASVRTQKMHQEHFGSVRTVGAYFITHNALIFELISILLLMAIVGVVVLLRSHETSDTGASTDASEGSSSASA